MNQNAGVCKVTSPEVVVATGHVNNDGAEK